MSANRLKLQGTTNEESRSEERDLNALLLGFYRALLREASEPSGDKESAEAKE